MLLLSVPSIQNNLLHPSTNNVLFNWTMIGSVSLVKAFALDLL